MIDPMASATASPLNIITSALMYSKDLSEKLSSLQRSCLQDQEAPTAYGSRLDRAKVISDLLHLLGSNSGGTVLFANEIPSNRIIVGHNERSAFSVELDSVWSHPASDCCACITIASG
jgi:hypothetical protein